MLPLSDSGHTGEKKGFIIAGVAFSSLYVFSIAMFYLLWDSYTKRNCLNFWSYLGIYLIYFILFVLVLRDLYKNRDFFNETKNLEGVEFIEEVHFLCANPVCPRCVGWYFGIALSLPLTFGMKDSIIAFMRTYNNSHYFTIIIGIILFVLSTPVHGSLIYLIKSRPRFLENKTLKLVMGLVSGLSLTLIATGILAIIT